MKSYLYGLEKRGISVRLTPDKAGLVIAPKITDPKLREQVISAKAAIIAELLAKEIPAGPRLSDIDPRIDLVEDAEPWQKLLRVAHESPLYGVLHGFRCQGARLERIMRAWRIRYDATRAGFKDQADFDFAYRRYLMPETDIISRKGSEYTRLMLQLGGLA